ncbi:mitofilin family membrane protein [Nisaea acidiphila]|uniref:Mitofilin family membrane protein n=1 Tax=Nisaea acidiphila TaxID=1862145 RepID=A0A9J7AM19_9PROT|nr:mitofilin family membrane protein [Nisaea acidiphila]UUX48520.1 mitofilin family membrane protein [Nisaea acidiphila]
MSDPKSENGKISDKEAVEALKDGEGATVIDAEPVGELTAKKVFSSRTKVIGILVVLLLLTGGVAAALYPLWQDDAEAFVAKNGIPVTVPEVPENGFYNTVEDVIAFLRGTPAEPAAKQAAEAQPAAEPEPDPLTVMAGRIGELEAQIATLVEELQEARSASSDASRSADETKAAIALLNSELSAKPAVGQEELAVLAERIEAMERRVDELALPPAGGAGSGSGNAGVNEVLLTTIGALRERIAALEAEDKVSTTDLDAVAVRIENAESGAGERIASLEAELASVRQLAEKRAPERERAGLLLLAVGQLEAVTVTSGGFAGQLASVKDLATDAGPVVADAISVLEDRSGGVATLAALTERFDDVAKAVSQAKIAGSDEGLIGKTLNTVASLVTVRRTDVAEGPGIDAILVRAETAIAADDLAGAVAALEELSGAPAERASGWLSAAKARLAVDAAVAELRGAALASVAKAG